MLAVAMTTSCGRGCSKYEGGPISVIVEQVRLQESSPLVIVPGVLIPHDSVEVKIPNAARIAEVFVNKGDRITEGSTLARLSDEEINLKISQLKAERKEAETALEKNSYLLKNRDRLMEEGKLDRTQYEGIEAENAHAEATLNRVKTDLAIAEYNLSRLQINSPVSGIIAEKYASPAMLAVDNQILFKIVNTNPILVSFPLSAAESAGIKLGTPINVKIAELHDKDFKAVTTYIGPEISQPGKTFEVWASISNPDHVLKAGMTAAAEFISTNVHKVIVVPTSSLISRDRDKFVFTVSNGIARQTKVSLRNIHDDVAEISNGLAENDLVVVKGANTLQDGAAVEMWRR